jgi:hypothetical protein
MQTFDAFIVIDFEASCEKDVDGALTREQKNQLVSEPALLVGVPCLLTHPLQLEIISFSAVLIPSASLGPDMTERRHGASCVGTGVLCGIPVASCSTPRWARR